MSLDDPDTLALEGLLRWYIDMGVDAAIDDAAHDRFVAPPPAGVDPRTAESPKAETPRPSAGPVPRAFDATPAAAEALVQKAEALAGAAATLDELRAAWETVPGCHLASTASRMIFSGGTPGAAVMLIGGAPEADDERQGEAFAGLHGKLLDAMLRAIGLDRGHVYLANIVPWRPPGGRAPTPLELSLCLPFARRQIALAAPSVLLCLGERAAQPLLATRDPISKLRGRWLSFEGEQTIVKTLVTFSPDHLLKQPLQKRRAWADLLMIETALRLG